MALRWVQAMCRGENEAELRGPGLLTPLHSPIRAGTLRCCWKMESLRVHILSHITGPGWHTALYLSCEEHG